ncbi:hypothetical protein Pint_11353 [Pistacia integerrima]|uniref:Uncharacterized protein n=1 Tax=Pistacia integerrima TaxID=434235 RepID=A0ACC0XGJ7_9ROSI|nr:hypothetical protein Pint_11353 [Pistacia integerrima]
MTSPQPQLCNRRLGLQPLDVLTIKLKELGMDIEKCVPGQYSLFCPAEKDTEKVFYGLDDIEGESDIIIVEGEIDKLSMEEVALRNCVGVLMEHCSSFHKRFAT